MNVSFTFKGFEPSEHIRNHAQKHIEKLTRFIGKKTALEIQIIMIVDKFRQKVEVKITGEGLLFSAKEITEDMYISIDQVFNKLETQVKKSMNRSLTNRRSGKHHNIDVFSFNLAEKDPTQIASQEYFSSKPMSIAEAAIQLEIANLEFFVFLNSETNRINVIYRRKNKNFGLIDPIIP